MSTDLAGSIRNRKKVSANHQVPSYVPSNPLKMSTNGDSRTVEGDELDVEESLNADLSHAFSPRPMKDPRSRPWNPKQMRASTDLHLNSQPSILSMGQQPDFRGFVNLAGIALVVMNQRLVIENMMKYGLLFQVPGNISSNWGDSWPALMIAAIIFFCAIPMSWLFEHLRYKNNIPIKTMQYIQTAHILLVFLAPMTFIWMQDVAIVSGFLLAFVCVVTSMKLVSYAHVSHDIANLGGKVLSFPGRDILVAANPGDNTEEVAKNVYVSCVNEYIYNLRRKQHDALSRLAQYQTNDSGASVNQIDTPVQFTMGVDIAGADANLSLFNDKKEQTPFLTSPLEDDVTALYYEDADSSSVTIELVGLKAPPSKLEFQLIDYVPNLAHAWYFYLCPTLVFQLSYPRTKKVRLGFVMRRLTEMAFISVLIMFMVDQYIRPTLMNSIKIIENKPFPQSIVPMLERILKLSIPNLFLWLLIFYVLFHSYLNLVGELQRFADRVFYLDWWNSEQMGVYWRKWNRPVHDWLAKHVYCVATRHGISNNMAKIIVFLVSALLHEVLISIPCHMIGYYAFLGMLLQVPSIYITSLVYKKFRNKFIGNISFWLTLPIVGQPVLILLYFYQYYITHDRLK